MQEPGGKFPIRFRSPENEEGRLRGPRRNSLILLKLLSGVPTGIRTPVSTVKGWCPRPLDDGDAVKLVPYPGRPNCQDIGGARRDRTADLLHAMQALSQLSYGPTGWKGRNSS